jgi:dipeptidyl aminopeptidase/acylaminoacyl peptidase
MDLSGLTGSRGVRTYEGMKITVNILIGLALLVVALSIILVYANTHPQRYLLHIPPSTYRAAYENATFETSDGITLKGWLIKPPEEKPGMPAIIICHGLGANRSDFTDLAVFLARRGYFVLTFDFRAHGTSDGSRSSLGYFEQKDVEAAIAFLAMHPRIDRNRIGIFGFSLGGSTAILTAARTGKFAAVAADSAFTSLRDQAHGAITGFYHLPSFPFVNLSILAYELYFQTAVKNISPESVIGRIAPVPLLIIAGEGDEMIPAENGRRLFRAAQEPKELWVIPVGGHGGTIASAGEEYNKRVGEFFDKRLQR